MRPFAVSTAAACSLLIMLLLLLGRIACTEFKYATTILLPILGGLSVSVCLCVCVRACVCVCVCTQTTEPIDMPFISVDSGGGDFGSCSFH